MCGPKTTKRVRSVGLLGNLGHSKLRNWSFSSKGWCFIYSKGTTNTSNMCIPHSLVCETWLILKEQPKLHVSGGDVEILRQPLLGEITGNSKELLTYIVELGYRAMKGTEYFMSHYNRMSL